MISESSDPPVIVVDGLEKQYKKGFFGKGVRALNGVSFDVRPGEIFALLGPNGAGKTTLIKILLGIIRRTGGNASLLGFPAGDRRGRMRVGYLPEHLRIPRHQTARTALEFYGQLSGMSKSEVRKKADGLLELVGLAGRDRESVKQFSKGMLQRLGLAQALLHDPELIILDEPTDGLDPVGRSQIRSILQRLRDEGRGVFLNSHLLQEVELVCDRVAILQKGTLRFVGTIDELTPDEAGEVELKLTGPDEAIRRVLPDWSATVKRSDANQPVEITLPAKDQAEVDSLIDRLRKESVSVCEMKWQGRTLEDAFLKLVGDSTGDPGRMLEQR